MLEAIGRNSRRLLSRIEDLLTVSGVEAGAMRLQAAPMSVQALVDSATSALVPTMRGRDLTLVVDVADDVATIVADAEKLDRVLINLLSNATKFTPDGGRITRVRRDGTRSPSPSPTPASASPWTSSPGLRAVLPVLERPGAGRPRHRSGPGDRQGHRRPARGSIALESAPGVGTEVTVVLPVDHRGGRRDDRSIAQAEPRGRPTKCRRRGMGLSAPARRFRRRRRVSIHTGSSTNRSRHPSRPQRSNCHEDRAGRR